MAISHPLKNRNSALRNGRRSNTNSFLSNGPLRASPPAPDEAPDTDEYQSDAEADGTTTCRRPRTSIFRGKEIGGYQAQHDRQQHGHQPYVPIIESLVSRDHRRNAREKTYRAQASKVIRDETRPAVREHISDDEADYQ